METELKICIIKTLCYADIFDYPLNKYELYKFLISKRRSSFLRFQNTLSYMHDLIEKTDEYYHLIGRSNIVILRKKREKESIKKLAEAKKIIKVISYIPTIKFIGISGSLSLMNSKKADDIDLFIITTVNTLWITRFLALVILIFLNKKRQLNDPLGTNKVCTNMFLSESKLDLPKRNLYTAHETIQLKIIVNRNSTYERFLSSNKWVLNFLANSYTSNQISKKMNNFLAHIIFPIEQLFYSLQLIYMRKKMTIERVEKHIAFFHPKDKTETILRSFKLRYFKYIDRLITSKYLFSSSKYDKISTLYASKLL